MTMTNTAAVNDRVLNMEGFNAMLYELDLVKYTRV